LDAVERKRFPLQQILGVALFDRSEVENLDAAIVVYFRRPITAGVENEITLGSNNAARQQEVNLVRQIRPKWNNVNPLSLNV
jgi:hypothetical protein